MSEADFAKIYNNVTTSTNTYFRGRVNVNTANADVLTALFMGLNPTHQRADCAEARRRRSSLTASRTRATSIPSGGSLDALGAATAIR